MPLYEVVVLEKPTKKAAEEGALEKVMFGPTTIVAKDDKAAGLSAIMDNGPALAGADRSRLEVLIRPFA